MIIDEELEDDVEEIEPIEIEEDGSRVIEIVKPNSITLYGHINTVRRGIAYLTLKNSTGQESFAECKKAILRMFGIGINDTFEVIISKPDGIVTVFIQSSKKSQQLLDWQFMYETVEQVLSDNKMTGNTEEKRYGN
jgi:hypothetical protein